MRLYGGTPVPPICTPRVPHGATVDELTASWTVLERGWMQAVDEPLPTLAETHPPSLPTESTISSCSCVVAAYGTVQEPLVPLDRRVMLGSAPVGTA